MVKFGHTHEPPTPHRSVRKVRRGPKSPKVVSRLTISATNQNRARLKSRRPPGPIAQAVPCRCLCTTAPQRKSYRIRQTPVQSSPNKEPRIMTVIEIPTPDPGTLDDLTRPFAEAIGTRRGQARYRPRRYGRGVPGARSPTGSTRCIQNIAPRTRRRPDGRERFLRETRTAAGLAHPNIVPGHSADEIDGCVVCHSSITHWPNTV